MSEINIQVVPGQQIEINGKKYETTGEFRKPVNGEHWLASNGNVLDDDLLSQPRLILRPLPIRKVPTDQDAAVWPRRKCWCDNHPINKKSPTGVLLHVDHRPNVACRYCVLLDNGSLVHATFCEIEVEE